MNSHHAAARVLLLITLGLIAVPTIKGDELTYEFEVEKAPPLGNKSLQEVSGVTRSPVSYTHLTLPTTPYV